MPGLTPGILDTPVLINAHFVLSASEGGGWSGKRNKRISWNYWECFIEIRRADPGEQVSKPRIAQISGTWSWYGITSVGKGFLASLIIPKLLSACGTRGCI